MGPGRPGVAAAGREALPLVRRFPALAAIPYTALGANGPERTPTPVESAGALAPGLWIKRDDLFAEPFGGNKVRALEFLLGGVASGDRVITVGSRGSTHVLATATYARRLGATISAFRWPQAMNPVAERVARRIEATADHAPMAWTPVGAYVRALSARLRGGRWVPAGGSSPVGVLGSVNAALELAEQIADGALPAPRRIVVPLGSGGTTAGLLLGLHLAGLDIEIVGVRVVPRIVASRRRVLALARATARLIERHAAAPVPMPSAPLLRVVHDYYGGAYGRVTAAATEAAERCARSTSATVDPTYSAKALAAAIAPPGGAGDPTLFWLTFDARMTI